MVLVRSILTTAALMALAAFTPVEAAVPLDSHAVRTGVDDILLGAGAATALMAGMVVVVAVSWRSFRDSSSTDRDDPFDWRDIGKDDE